MKNLKSISNLGFYKYLKGKRKKFALNEMYLSYMITMSANQFKYKTPDFNKTYYEQSILTGTAVFYKCNQKQSVNYNKWCCTPASPADVPDNEGIAKKYTTHGSDYAQEITPDKDGILIFNNSLHTPETYFCNIAEMLTETDVSTKALIKWSRMSPIPKVKSDNDIVKYTEAMNRVLNGEEITVISEEFDELSDGHKTIDDNILRISDEQAIDKMHFYSEFYDQLIRRVCTMRGIPFSTNAKSSQNLTEELHDMDIFALLYIKDCYETRKECFKKCQEFSGFDFDFEWSDTMKIQIEKIEKMNSVENVSHETIENSKGGENGENLQTKINA